MQQFSDQYRSAQSRSDRQSPAADAPQGPFAAPSIGLASGGGAIRSIDQTFSVNPVNGTSGIAIPLPEAAARLQPGLGLSYNSGAGNGPFGLGWSLGLGGIERLTARRLPRYRDGPEGDVFVLADAEELVPAYEETAPGIWEPDTAQDGPRSARRYRPRIEGGFARIERISIPGEPDHWRVTSRDNSVTVYGRTDAARIADPADPARVFRWLPEWRYDDKGNAIRFVYAAEDMRGVPDRPEEAHRRAPGAFANRHLKRVSYGNRAPFLPDTARPLDVPGPPAAAEAWMFHMVFDYGDHDDAAPELDPDRDWPMRHDAFSDHRPGFEIRSYRLCRRVLRFHVFDDLRPGPLPEVVASLEFFYRHMTFDGSPPGRAEVELLERMQERGWRRTGPAQFLTRTGPETQFDYAEPAWDRTVREIAQEDAAGAPQGFTGPYQPVDLDGDGIAEIVHGAGGALWYKRNLGAGRFAAPEPLPQSPHADDLARGSLRFEDVDGTGRPAMVLLDRGRRGAFVAEDDGFAAFRPFARDLPFDMADPKLRFADLDGDGRADALTMRQGRLTWFRSAGPDGFDPPEMAPAPVLRGRGTAIETGAEGGAAAFFADMSGDGLADYVRVTRAGVSYWPNLGYGDFGAEVRMADAPLLDAPDAFDPRLVRLADLSGAGPADLIYLGGAEIRVWVNLSGNGFAEPRGLGRLPGRGPATEVGVFDILGHGTAALILSSPLPSDARAPMRYVDLMGGRKPWLITTVRNGLGAETTVAYRAASAYALDDRRAGRPWATRLPVPVMCVAETATTDAVTGARITRTYRYRHGHYDGTERAFRGFAMVETRDTEEFARFAAGAGGALIDRTLFAPPAVQRNWFHTGAWPGGDALADRLAQEYYDSPATPETRPEIGRVLPAAPQDAAQRRDAARALKGAPLRTETWAEDGTPAAATPYVTEDRAPGLLPVQPALDGYPAVYLPYERERVVRHYEREAADPRVLHSLALAVDDIGNVTSQASVAYGRGMPDPSLPPEIQGEQARTRVTHVATTMTGDVVTATAHRRRQVAEMRSFEVLGLSPSGPLFAVEALAAAIAGAPQIGAEAPVPAGPARRPLSARRSLYAQDLSPTSRCRLARPKRWRCPSRPTILPSTVRFWPMSTAPMSVRRISTRLATSRAQRRSRTDGSRRRMPTPTAGFRPAGSVTARTRAPTSSCRAVSSTRSAR